MKAYVYRRYGGPDVLRLEEVPKPTPRPDEILVKVLATTITAADRRALALDLPRGFGPMGRLVFGVTRPRKPILGLEMAGVVESVGAKVARFRPGDVVFADTGGKMGCHAEYQTVRADGAVAPKPARLSVEEAAALTFGGVTALHFLGRAKLSAGERVLVVGASGGVGTAMVQLAKHLGAHVTGVTSGRNVALVRALGADEAIDRTSEDFTQRAETYDVIADAAGATTFARCKHVLRDGGRFLVVAGDLAAVAGAPLARAAGGKRAISGVATSTKGTALALAALAEDGALKPHIDRVFPFAQLPEAHAYVATGRKRGAVVVRVAEGA